MKTSDKILVIILSLFIAAELYLVAVPGECNFTSMSEKYVNFIDDDCDGLVDEDYAGFTCGNGIVEKGEFCDDGNLVNLDGCSWDCKKETKNTIYVAPYVGDIDGDFDSRWYNMFERITDFFNKNHIHAGFSFYPASIKEGEFARIFAKMYESPYIYLIQKSYRAGPKEQKLYALPYEEQVEILEGGKNYYRKTMSRILDIPESEVKVSIAYNQPQGILTPNLARALKESGFRIFFDMYKGQPAGVEWFDAVKSTKDFAVVQYGAGMTIHGETGRNTYFRTPEQVIEDIKTQNRLDVHMMLINGKRVVPIWCHPQDFERRDIDNVLDEEKWKTYAKTMIMLKEDPDIVIVDPYELYNLYRQAGSSTEIDVGVPK